MHGAGRTGDRRDINKYWSGAPYANLSFAACSDVQSESRLQLPCYTNTWPDTEPGINGGLLPRHSPGQPCVNTIMVANLDAGVAAITSHGGKTAMPKMAVPGVGWLAYCFDPEGNMFGMMQADTSAA